MSDHVELQQRLMLCGQDGCERISAWVTMGMTSGGSGRTDAVIIGWCPDHWQTLVRPEGGFLAPTGRWFHVQAAVEWKAVGELLEFVQATWGRIPA